jgi:hypothetical protein
VTLYLIVHELLAFLVDPMAIAMPAQHYHTASETLVSNAQSGSILNPEGGELDAGIYP